MRTYFSFSGRLMLVVLLMAGVVTPVHAVGLSDPVALTDSYKPVAPTQPVGATPVQPFITRNVLKAEENEAPLKFEVALKMRNFADLQARIAHGEQISSQEMAAKYEPLAADYRKVTAWAASQGFTVTREDSHHMALFVTGKVNQIQKAMSVSFARVSFRNEEFTSAVNAPSVPAWMSSMIVGVNGLQPHLHPHKHIVKQQKTPDALGGSASYKPSQIAAAYNATSLYSSNITGTGQAIAVVIDTFPATSDLTLFWSKTGVAQSLTNIQFIQVVSGELPAPSGEESLDTEWASGLAPGAHVRVYAATDLANSDLDACYQQIYDDVTTHPEYGIHQMSMSYGEGEQDTTFSQVQTDDQYYAELTAAGVTVFASTGDGGSTPDGDGNLQADTPASDPNVTAVGGTSLVLNASSNVTSETVWNNSTGAGGGGTSIYYSRPSWQTGAGVNMAAKRQIPDISLTADPNYGAITYLSGSLNVVGGTSWSSPSSAAFCALMNQARANAGLGAVGLLGPQIYPLIGTAEFRDITSGNNIEPGSGGKYVATVGYDEASGIGVPLMETLTQQLVGSTTLVGVTPSVPVQEVTPNQNATYTVAASGSSATFQWQRMPIGSSTWTNLTDGGAYSGSATASLTVTGAALSMSGDQFQCLVNLGTSIVTTAASILIVDRPLQISTLAGRVGVTGLANGAGTLAEFYYPSAIAINSTGDLFIADYSNNSIREVTPTGTVSTPFGSASGLSGSTNGNGNSALFNSPNAVAIDGLGNIYVADTGNNIIRKISGNTVSTFAGTVNGFNTPEGIATDTAGNVYVADTNNDVIRKITPAGVVSTLAGSMGVAGYADGSATTQALFSGPTAVAVDSLGNVYVADFGNYVVRKISGGTVTTIAGQAGESGYLDGLGSNSLFNGPIGLAVDDSNNLLITDCLVPAQGSTAAGNDVLRKLSTTGVVSTIAGNPGATGSTNGTGTAAEFYSPQAVAYQSGQYFIADTYNQTIRQGTVTGKISAPVTLGNLAATYNGTPQAATATTSPSGLAVIVTYNGSTTAPTNAGSYTVVATVNDPNYQGSATGTLVIAQAAASVTLGNLADTYNGASQAATATTSPSGLVVIVTYNGSTTAPTNAGSYTVVATVNDPNYQGGATGTLVIAKVTATVTLGNLSGAYNGSGYFATATTVPAGLNVSFTYNGVTTLPVAVGSYAVVGMVNNANYTGTASGTLVISPGLATVTFGNLTFNYNGAAHPATATTSPAGLGVTFTYNGGSTVPINAGSYTVVATVNNANYTGSATSTLVINKPAATVTLGSLAATYNGSAQAATVTTSPAGVSVALTYNGSATAPTNAGSYTVVATVNDPNYSGAATGTLVIGKATAIATLGGLAATYDGTAKSATATTNPSGLNVTFTYSGSATAPTNAGSYTVVGTVNDPNYTGSATGTLVISKATATATLSNLAATYDGTAKSATATTTPVGLNVTLTYNGSATVPTNAGSYTVLATITDPNYTGTATGTLVIAKSAATINLASLAAIYTGTGKAATATTVPAGLPVTFTYNGVATLPVAVGSYAVVATVNTANASGTGSGTLVISPGVAAVTFGNLNFTYNGAAHPATATTVPAGLSVTFTYNGSATAPTAVGSYTVVATVNNANYTGTATGTLVIGQAAATVTLGSLAATYNGAAHAATVTTVPASLNVTFTYNGSASAPINAGSYTVVGTVNDPNYTGTATGTLVIAKSAATVVLSNLAATYDGTAKSVTATTSPVGLSVAFTYNGSATVPANAGSYAVVATITDPNYTGMATGTLVIAKSAATVALSNLAATYDGTAKSATATTSPLGLSIALSYNGSATVPTNAGSYTVVGTITDPNYSGTVTGTLVIAKGTATINLTSLAATYTGTGKAATATTVPAGLPVTFTYNGVATLPVVVGSYAVVATVNTANASGAASGTLVISPGVATVTFGTLTFTYNGAAHPATATTVPAGLSVTFTYNGGSTVPITVGSYTVVATVNNANYTGGATITLVINKPAATVTLGSLAGTYNGAAHAATATTVPAGLNVTLTYNGSATAPTNAGSYTVVGTVNDPNYSGTATGTLVISKATATATFGSLAATYDGTAKSATATTSPTGLNVGFTYNGSATAPTNVGSYTVVGTVNDPNYQGSATGTLVIGNATATATLSNLAATYDGTVHAATATTSPVGLTVTFTYNGSATAPTNAGSYTVVGTITDPNYAGSATGTLAIAKGTPTITLGSLNVNYTGAAHAATATTVPGGLAVTFTYNGSVTAPTAVGGYTVVGTVNTANYAGSATGTLTIAPMLAVATTVAATNITGTGATLNGKANPETSDTQVSFQYGTTIAYGSTTGSQDVGSGAAIVGFSAPITVPAQTVPVIYHYRAVATNAGGTAFGLDQTFTSLPEPAIATAAQASLSASGSEVSLTVNPNGVATSVFFQYGLTTTYGTTTATQNLGSGTTPVNVFVLFPGLLPNTTYHYQLVMVSAAGTFYGPDQFFTTLGFDTILVAQKGDAAAGTTTTFASFGNPAVNINTNDGVAFTSKLTLGASVSAANNIGIWADDNTGTRQLIAQLGSAAPGTAGTFLTLSDPVYNANSAVAFCGTLKGVSVYESPAVWSTSSGSLQLVAERVVTQVPGYPAGVSFNVFTALGLSDTKGVVLYATLNVNYAAGVNSTNNAGIWEGNSASDLALVLQLGQVVDGETITKLTFLPTETYVNGQTRSFAASGDIVCGATFSDGTTGLVRVIGGTPHVVLASGTSADGIAGATFAAFGNPAINDFDRTAFAATLTSGLGGITTTNNSGIWADNSTGTRQLIAQNGSGAAPGTTANFATFSDPVYNNNEAIAFRATLKVAAGQATTATSTGIWCNSAGTLALVAQQGVTPAPGCPAGATFATFTELALPDQGGVNNLGGAVFLATLNTNAAAGVATTNNLGIWAVDNNGSLQLIVRTGDILNGKTVTGLSFLPSLATVNGQSRSFAQGNGDLVYLATFSDGSTAIFNVVF